MDKGIKKLIITVLASAVVMAAIVSYTQLDTLLFALMLMLLWMLGAYTGMILFGGYHTHLKMPGSEKSAMCGEHTDKTEVTENIDDVDCEICLKNEITRLRKEKGEQ